MFLAEEGIRSPQKVSWDKSVGPFKLVTLVISGIRFLKFYFVYKPGSSVNLFPLFSPFLVLSILLLFLQTTCSCLSLCDTWDIQGILEISSNTQK